MWIERRKLLEVWDAAQAAGEEVAFASIVRVEGSSYRKPGATMVLTRSGRRVGMVSGGCLEGEVGKKIWWLTESGPAVEVYNTSFDDDGQAHFGLGCGGRISLLLERGESARERVEAMRRSIERRTASAVMTVIEAASSPGNTLQVGTRVVVTEGEQVSEQMPGARFHSEQMVALRAAGLTALTQRCSAVLQTGVGEESITVFAEYMAPSPRLLIFGAGDDAQPLAGFAAAMGWEVAVADGRSNLVTPARFPSAERVMILDDRPWDELGITSWDAAVLLTHSYEQDRKILGILMPLNLRYVGVLGPRRRTVQLVEEVSGPLGLDPALSLNQLHSPAGLDLGSDGPEAIALAIVAEIQATFEARSGGPLSLLCPPARLPILATAGAS